jgi:signal transduction histidine kinase
MNDPSPGKILVVDDTPASRYLAARILKQAGHEILEAASGAEAIAIATDEQPNVIVLDVKLPDMVGFAVTERLKTQPQTCHIAILQVSASYTSADAHAFGLQRGADAYLTLPIEPQILIATTAALLRLHRAERALQAAIQARDEFISMASHDLRGPVAAVQLSNEMALRQLAQPASTETTRMHLERAAKQARELAQLLERLLDISQISAGGINLRPETCDIAQVVRDVLMKLEGPRQQSGSTISLDAKGPVTGYWDRARVDQIVSNLVSNAIKYGSGKPIEISLRQLDDQALLTVRDHGPGISLERQKAIFERFERAQPGRISGSYGLGLWIVRNLAEALGGTVSVESDVGHGALFSLLLPLQAQASRPSAV